MAEHFSFLKKTIAGFTLVEMMIIVTMLGILSLGGFASYLNSQRTTRDVKRKTDIETIRQALEMYKSDNSAYPDTGSNTNPIPSTACTTSSNPNFLKCYLTFSPSYLSATNFPKDPLSTQFYYYDQVTSTTYKLCALLEGSGTNESGTVCKTGTQCNYCLTQP